DCKVAATPMLDEKTLKTVRDLCAKIGKDN
ncbi:hypothetical protein EJB05_50367, partial [Eragrostis curvula]